MRGGINRNLRLATVKAINQYIERGGLTGGEEINDLVVTYRNRSPKSEVLEQNLKWAFKFRSAETVESVNYDEALGMKAGARLVWVKEVAVRDVYGTDADQFDFVERPDRPGTGRWTTMNVITDADVAHVIINGVRMRQEDFIENGGLASMINSNYIELAQLEPDELGYSRNIIQHGDHMRGMEDGIKATYKEEYFTSQVYSFGPEGYIGGENGSGTMQQTFEDFADKEDHPGIFGKPRPR